MSKKIALAAALAAWTAVIALSPAASAGGKPPLEGLFKDNFSLLDPPVPAPATGFLDAGGETISLEAFAGRVVLLNFWATWCAPCIRELPTMARLQTELGPEGLSVVALSQDRGGLSVVRPFLEQLGVGVLEAYVDQKGALARDFGLVGLPTTYLLDAKGRIVGGLEGPAEWDSPDAKTLIRFYLDQAGPGPVKTGDFDDRETI